VKLSHGIAVELTLFMSVSDNNLVNVPSEQARETLVCSASMTQNRVKNYTAQLHVEH
jgi:hypothetical protein